MLIVIGILLLASPARAGSKTFDNLLPSLMQNSLKIPILSEVLASEQIEINAIDNSGRKGSTQLKEVPENLDTKIMFQAFGLKPAEQYIAIYYQNSDCKLEEGSTEKSVKGAFFANANGEASFEDIVKDSINRIGSVSIRTTKDFKLVACGRV